MPVVYLGLGTNLGDRRRNIERTVQAIGRAASVSRVSRFYASAPVGFTDQPTFWNAVVRASTALPPGELIIRLKEIERDIGRVPSFPNGPRLIDIDILFYGDAIIDDDALQIPHPRALERAFVLRPLAEVAPHLRDPRTGDAIADALERVADQDAAPVRDSE